MNEWETSVKLTITNINKYEWDDLNGILERLKIAKISNIALIIEKLWEELLIPGFRPIDDIKDIPPIRIHTRDKSIKIDDMVITYNYVTRLGPKNESDTELKLSFDKKKTYDDPTLEKILKRLSKLRIPDIKLIVSKLKSELKEAQPGVVSL
jgi:hypothetical protein